MKRSNILSLSVGLAVCLLIAAICCFGDYLSLFSSVEAFSEYVQSCAPYSHLCFFLLQLLSVVAAPIPSNLSAAAGGVLFGVWPSFFLTFTAVLLGSMMVFALARVLGRPFVDRVVSRRQAGKYLAILREKTAPFLFLAFLFPWFPDDVLCILAGLTHISPLPFFLIVLAARPWGLLFACALGGAAISLPLWAMVLLGLAGAALFVLGMKYSSRIEGGLTAKMLERKKVEKN